MQSVLITKDNPIIRIEPYNNSFIVHWLVGKKCNFNCSYCPDMWHDTKGKNKSIDELKKTWLRIIEVNQSKKQKYDLDLTHITLSYMKKNNILISRDCLNDSQIQLILKIYEEDILFINELTNKFNYCL